MNLNEISDERLLSLGSDDLTVVDYFHTCEYLEAKLKCGLYAYVYGNDDNKYGRVFFDFFGEKRTIKVNERSVKDVDPKNWYSFYQKKKCDKKDPKYPKLKEIAENIMNSSSFSKGYITFKSVEHYI